MEHNYSNFYLSMILGTTLMAGAFFSFELDFMSIEWILAWVLWVSTNLLSMLYVRERIKFASRGK